MATRKYSSLDEFFNETGQTHEWLADRLGVDRSYVSLMRSGNRQPSLPLALVIQRITGVPVERLVRES